MPGIPVYDVSQGFLDNATGAKSRYGLWSPIHVAYVLEGIAPELRRATVKHERCHEQMFRLTGSPDWH